jgi:hypothetical protein
VTDRADVNRLSAAQKRLVSLAKADLTALFGTLDLSNPAVARDALLEAVPLLVREYGDLAATAAAEWFEQVRPYAGFNAQTVEAVSTDQVQGAVRYAAGNLWSDEPQLTLAELTGAIQRFVMYSGRQTVARNAQHDPSKPRFARVPTGEKTCAFCEMMASRGWVYHTKDTAGLTEKFHDDCTCQIVAEWDSESAHIVGYDPDAMYARYLSARHAVGGDPSDILAEMRRQNPDLYTDGVHEH